MKEIFGMQSRSTFLDIDSDESAIVCTLNTKDDDDIEIECSTAAFENKLPILELPHVLAQRLFEHQQFGVNWLYNLFLQKSGGILADDMGLGKVSSIIFLNRSML